MKVALITGITGQDGSYPAFYKEPADVQKLLVRDRNAKISD